MKSKRLRNLKTLDGVVSFETQMIFTLLGLAAIKCEAVKEELEYFITSLTGKKNEAMFSTLGLSKFFVLMDFLNYVDLDKLSIDVSNLKEYYDIRLKEISKSGMRLSDLDFLRNLIEMEKSIMNSTIDLLSTYASRTNKIEIPNFPEFSLN